MPHTYPDVRSIPEGGFPELAWPGGYPILYLDDTNTISCAKCAEKLMRDAEADSGDPIAVTADIHWEGELERCEDCGAVIESAYGVPDGDQQWAAL